MRLSLALAVLPLAKFGEIAEKVVVLLHEGEVFAVLEKGVGRFVLYSDGWAFFGQLGSSSDGGAGGLPMLETE